MTEPVVEPDAEAYDEDRETANQPTSPQAGGYVEPDDGLQDPGAAQ